MQPQRFSRRLCKAKESNASEKEEHQKKSTRMNSAKKPAKKGSGINIQGTKNNENEATVLHPSGLNESSKKGACVNFKESINGETNESILDPTVSQPTSKDCSIDISLFESDTPRRKYGTNALNLKSSKTGKGFPSNNFGKQTSSFEGHSGKASSRGQNITDSERLSYIKYQARDVRNECGNQLQYLLLLSTNKTSTNVDSKLSESPGSSDGSNEKKRERVECIDLDEYPSDVEDADATPSKKPLVKVKIEKDP